MTTEPATERIIRAACRWRGGVWSLPEPKRHGDVLMLMYEMMGDEHAGMDGEQGFMTNQGRFVDRKIGRRIAIASGQYGDGEGPPHPEQLFSEDLW